VRYRGKVIKSAQKQGRNTEKSTKYAIRSLNNGDFSREMAFFEHVLGRTKLRTIATPILLKCINTVTRHLGLSHLLSLYVRLRFVSSY